MSEASARQDPRVPECPNDTHASTRMRPAVLRVHFPAGALPVEGYKCPQCGEETIPAGVVARTQTLAKRIGLFGPEARTTRRLVKNGSSLAVTLDAHLLEEIFGFRPEAGAEVIVGRQGAGILVEPAPAPSKGARVRRGR